MIQHEALPIDPDHKEVFDVPKELNLGVNAYIKIYQHGEYIGEASALDKIPHVSHAWGLSRVLFFSPVTLKEEIEIITSLYAADQLCYLDTIGWVVRSYRDTPLQETKYVGMLNEDSIIRDITVNNVRMYDYMGFVAKRKGSEV